MGLGGRRKSNLKNWEISAPSVGEYVKLKITKTTVTNQVNSTDYGQMVLTIPYNFSV